MDLKVLLLLIHIIIVEGPHPRNIKSTYTATDTSKHSDLPYAEIKVKTPFLPAEMWLMILGELPTFKDMASAVIGTEHFRILQDAPKIFKNLGLKGLESIYNDFQTDPEKALEHTKSALKLYKVTLTYPRYKSVTYVLLWKLFSIIPRYNIENYDSFDEVMIPFVKAHVDGKGDIERYTQFKEELVHHSKHLNLVHHVNILARLRESYPHTTDGWRRFGYMLLLESSNHLAKKISDEIMLTIMNICCGANGQYIFHINAEESVTESAVPKSNSIQENVKGKEKSPKSTISNKGKDSNKQKITKQKEPKMKSDDLLVEKRFELNWNFYKGKMTNEFKIRSSVEFANTAAEYLSIYYKFYCYDKRKFEYTQVISAIVEILSHKPADFKKLVDEIQVNLAFFDLEISDPFVRKCRKWLEEKCKGSEKLLKTGLNDQMIALNKINKNRFELSDRDAFLAVYNPDESGNLTENQKKYMKQLETWFEETCNVENMENFSDYIKILKVLRGICVQNYSFLESVWVAFFNFAQKPSLFTENSDELFEVDELYSFMTPIDFNVDKDCRKRAKDLLDVAFPKFEHIFHMKPKESKNDRRKRRVLLKILLMLANRAYNASDEASIDEEGINRMNRITGLIYLLARDDDLSEVSPSQDSIFLDEWFFNGFPRFTEMRNKIINRNNDDFNFVFQPIQDTKNRSPLLYHCLLKTLEALTEQEATYPPDLLKNLVIVGDFIDQEKALKRSIKDAFELAKYKVYDMGFVFMEPYLNQINVPKVFIEKTIDLLLNKHLTSGLVDGYEIYEAIRSAVAKSHSSGVDVKGNIGKELIGILNQMFELYLHNYEEDFKEYDLRGMYDELNTLLEFPYNLSGMPSDEE